MRRPSAGASRPRRGQNPRRYAPAPAKFALDGETRSCSKAPFTGGPRRVRPQRRRGRPQADRCPPLPCPVPFATARPPPEPTVADTVENSVCSRRPRFGWMPVHGMSTYRPSAASVELCWPWRPFWAMWCVHRRPAVRNRFVPRRAPVPPSPSLSGGVAWGGAGRPVGGAGRGRRGARQRASTESDGTSQGEGYYRARGEILRPPQDHRRRRRFARLCSSIKNESPGSKDDQTPS